MARATQTRQERTRNGRAHGRGEAGTESWRHIAISRKVKEDSIQTGKQASTGQEARVAWDMVRTWQGKRIQKGREKRLEERWKTSFNEFHVHGGHVTQILEHSTQECPCLDSCFIRSIWNQLETEEAKYESCTVYLRNAGTGRNCSRMSGRTAQMLMVSGR